ncbi:MAG: FAD-binding oxidoreductase [Alphaproteobacteria bacterium]|nr:FAD-binding oxidoreductase [Alphaproteobacteria bacterium]
MTGSRPENEFPLNRFGYPAITYNDAAGDEARPFFPPLNHNIKADVAIIGGGHVGLSTALYLAGLAKTAGKEIRIVLVDAGRIGAGPSGKSAGHISGLQAEDSDVIAHCGKALGEKLIAAAAKGPALVRDIAGKYGIPCDLRNGYMSIDNRNGQEIIVDGVLGGIDPYPFVLGQAKAARGLGVEIYENTKASALREENGGCAVLTPNGTISASCAVGAGAHLMGETIKAFEPLRRKTIEFLVSTIITPPLPESVLQAVMPGNAETRFPFSNENRDVAFGSIDRAGRIVFGAGASVGMPNVAAIEAKLHGLFPRLRESYFQAAGQPLECRPFVEGEKLDFTAELLPDVGVIGAGNRVFYAHALGGHGVATGTLLGKAIAEKIWGGMTKNPALGETLDLFASVKHFRMPSSKPLRWLAGAISLCLSRHETADRLFLRPSIRFLARLFPVLQI